MKSANNATIIQLIYQSSTDITGKKAEETGSTTPLKKEQAGEINSFTCSSVFLSSAADHFQLGGGRLQNHIGHTRAMHLYQHGMDLTLIAHWLGHKQLETTLIYAYADTETKRKAIEKAKGVEIVSQEFGMIQLLV